MNRTLAVMQMEMRSRLVVKQDDAQQIVAQTQRRAQQQLEQKQWRRRQQRRLSLPETEIAAVAPSTHRNSGFDGIKTLRTFNLTYFCV